MFKIQLADGFYQNKSGRIQHFFTQEIADAKIKKMGIAANVVKCNKKAAATKEKPKEKASVPKVNKTKKAAFKPEKPANSKEKTKKNKKA